MPSYPQSLAAKTNNDLAKIAHFLTADAERMSDFIILLRFLQPMVQTSVKGFCKKLKTNFLD